MHFHNATYQVKNTIEWSLNSHGNGTGLEADQGANIGPLPADSSEAFSEAGLIIPYVQGGLTWLVV